MVVGIDDKYPAKLTRDVKQRVFDLSQSGESYFVVADPFSDVGLLNSGRAKSHRTDETSPVKRVGRVVKGVDRIREKISQKRGEWWEEPKNAASVAVLRSIATTRGRITYTKTLIDELNMTKEEGVEFDTILETLEEKGLIQVDRDGLIMLKRQGANVYRRIESTLGLGR